MKLSALLARLEGDIALHLSSSFPSTDNLVINTISLDSQNIQPDTLFAAMQGQSRHGIDFASQAREKGANGLFCDEICLTHHPDLLQKFDYILTSKHTRTALGEICAAFYSEKPNSIIAITGTNGKTSIASFYRQIAEFHGKNAGQIGTTGVIANGLASKDTLTSPDVVTLHQLLADLKTKDITHIALEASSHGLDQQRLAGISLSAIGFSNLSQDHLDYHATMEDYLQAKLRLFKDFAHENCPAVINMKTSVASQFFACAKTKNAPIISITYDPMAQGYIHLIDARINGYSQNLSLKINTQLYEVNLPLAGAFQVENALVALGLAIGSGLSIEKSLEALNHLKGAKGRLEHVATTQSGAGIFIDYAHTPDALEKALTSLRTVTKGKLWVIFGAGGNRDQKKRALMGEVAQNLSDIALITDDNPRYEDPASIRSMIKNACPKGQEISPRSEAVSYAIHQLESKDSLLIAGKGHETYQEIKGEKFYFSDHDEVKKNLV